MTPSDRYLTGYRGIEESLKSGPTGAVLLAVTGSARVGRIVSIARSHGVPVELVSRKSLRQRAGESARDCALLVAPDRQTTATLESISNPEAGDSLIIVLDHVTDPHNLGAILRSADLFGADGVIVPDRRSADITPVVVQSSAGAAGHVPVVRVSNLARAVQTLKEREYWIYGADMSGQRADTVDLSGRVVAILGSEGHGLSELLRNRSDALVSLPAAGHVDSFNVSVAAGILMYEIRRQQKWFDRE